jgi:alpha-glucosidase
VDAVWISPFFPSPMKDFGYDVADYCGVDPQFGSLEDFDALLAEAHARSIRVMIDWVPAHTSDEHPWFREARASRENGKRDWYVWRDSPADGALPNNWRAAFLDVPAWTFDAATGQYYLHSFLKEQPDLNWANPEVVAALHETLRFWLDRGVDGFRADVVHNIGKDPTLADHPEAVARIPHCALNDRPETHAHLREIRGLLDAYPGDRCMVGEVFLLDTARMAEYYGAGDELHMSFNFPPLFAPLTHLSWRSHIETTLGLLDPRSAWPTWVLSNHDRVRHRTRYGGEPQARLAAVLLLTLRGTPFLYMGEEWGLEDAVVPDSRKLDPGGRDGCRAPLPWDGSEHHGWNADAWLPFPPDAPTRNAESQRADADSILQLYRRLLAARRASRALRRGRLTLRDTAPPCLVYDRIDGDERRCVAFNVSDASVACPLDGAFVVEIDGLGGSEGEPFAGRLAPWQALVLAPA